jgi:thiol-disulfide isomerase/thioredoxin
MTRPLPLPALPLILLCLAPLAAARAAEPDTTGASYPDFTLADIHGKPHTLSSYRGRWVILNFWATWCPPCLEELPELVAYQAAHPEQVLLGIDFEQVDPHELQTFAKAHHLNYPVLMISDQRLEGLEPIAGLPTTIIITPAGELIAKHVGTVTRRTLEEFIAREQAAMDKAAGSTAQ